MVDVPKEPNAFPVVLLAPKENPDDPPTAVPPNVDCAVDACGVVEGLDASTLNPNAEGPRVEAGVVVVGPKEKPDLEVSAPAVLEAGGVANENGEAFAASPGFEVDPNAIEAPFPPNTFVDPKGVVDPKRDEAVCSDAGFCASLFGDVTPNPEVAEVPNVDEPKADLDGTVLVAPGIGGADVGVNEKVPGFCAPLGVVAGVVDEGRAKLNGFAGAGPVAVAGAAPKPEKAD